MYRKCRLSDHRKRDVCIYRRRQHDTTRTHDVQQSHKETDESIVPVDVKGTGPISRTPALMGNYGTDPVFNDE